MLLLFTLLFSILFAAPQKAAAKKENIQTINFGADVSRLMKLIINSLYSNKEIFLRELISNSADALNKVKVESKTNPEILGTGDMQKLEIKIIPDEDAETITIIDTGIGMSRDELIKNLGTIAHSGTLKFFELVANGTADTDLIGQFGVGFYSAFLVATKVVVTSKRYNTTQHIWSSVEAKAFTIQEDKTGEDLQRGTKVVLHLKDARYANSSICYALVSKYSQFVNFPIFMRFEKEDQWTYERRLQQEERLRKGLPLRKNEKLKETEKFDDEETEEFDDEDLDFIPEPVFEFQQINKQLPIWMRDPESQEDDDYISFTEYDDFFHTITWGVYLPDAPIGHLHHHQRTESRFKTIIYIPPKIPRGRNKVAACRPTRLRMYVKKVMVTEELMDFLPIYLTFVRGVIEMEDLRDPLIEGRDDLRTKKPEDDEDEEAIPMNISRQMLQESSALKKIGAKLTKLIIEYLVGLSERARKDESDEDVEAYDTFYREYVTEVKHGMRIDEENKMQIAKLLRFNSSLHPEKLISLDDYIEEAAEKLKTAKEEAKYNTASSSYRRGGGRDRAERLPILYFAVQTEDIDKALSFMRQSPFLQPFIADKRDVILLFDPSDEALLLRLMVFSGHPIVSVQEELRERMREIEERSTLKNWINKWKSELGGLVNWASSVLSGRVDRVEVSTKLPLGDLEKAREQERQKRMDEEQRRREKEEYERQAEYYSSRRKKIKVKKDDDNSVFIAGKEWHEEEKKEKKYRAKHPRLLSDLHRERAHYEKLKEEGREIPPESREAIVIKRSRPCAVIPAEGALSSGINNLYKGHSAVTPEIKQRMDRRVFELNPLSPLVQRLNRALKAIQARKAEETMKENLEQIRKREETFQRAKEEGKKLREAAETGTTSAENTTSTTESSDPTPPEILHELPRQMYEGSGDISEGFESPTVSDMRKLEALLISMYETALLNDGYGVDEKADYSERLFDILSTMTGLPHAPVLPDELDEDFEDWLEKEVEAERILREREREEKRKRAMQKAQKKVTDEVLKAGGKTEEELEEEEMADMTEEERIEFKKKKKAAEKRRETREKERSEKKKKKKNKRPDDSYFDEVSDDEDPEDIVMRKLEERKELRKKRLEEREKMRQAAIEDSKQQKSTDESSSEETTAEVRTARSVYRYEQTEEERLEEEEEERRQHEKREKRRAAAMKKSSGKSRDKDDDDDDDDDDDREL